MSVNQKITELLKRGDIQRIADIVGDSHQNISRKLKATKDINDVWILLAVCDITGKPLDYFLKQTDNNQLNEPTAAYGYKTHTELIEENTQLKKELAEFKEKTRKLQEKLISYLEGR